MENTREPVPISADIPLDLRDAIDRLAEADGRRSRASIIRLALEEYVAARDRSTSE